MNDYRLISRDAAGDILLLRHTSDLHAEHLAWLTDEISRPAGRMRSWTSLPQPVRNR